MDNFRNMFKNVKNWYQGEDFDPYSLIFVVLERYDDNPEIVITEEAAVRAALQAMLGIFEEYGSNEELTDRIDKWTNSRIRKIVKRAHGSKWRKAFAAAGNDGIPAYVAKHENAYVICFAPMRLSEQPKAIKNLQVSNLDLVRMDEKTIINNPSSLHIVLEQTFDMSTGKAIAQYGHALQLAFKELSDEEFERWRMSGYSFDIDRQATDTVLSKHTCQVIVHDAGFTEIEAGSLTAVAYLE